MDVTSGGTFPRSDDTIADAALGLKATWVFAGEAGVESIKVDRDVDSCERETGLVSPADISILEVREDTSAVDLSLEIAESGTVVAEGLVTYAFVVRLT